MLSTVLLWALVGICMISGTAAVDPTAGMSCKSKQDCNPTSTLMICLAHSGHTVCNCAVFRPASGYNLTNPVFNPDVKKCVVKTGEGCQNKPEDSAMPCEPGSHCDLNLIPLDEHAGVCVASAPPTTTSTTAAPVSGGPADAPLLSLTIITAAVISVKWV